MPGIPELLLILVIVLIIFGPGKLPQIGEALGRTIRNFRKSSKHEDDKEIDVTPKKGELQQKSGSQISDAQIVEAAKEKDAPKTT